MTTETDEIAEIESHDRLRDRIERVYMKTTMEDSPHGALSWFARRANLKPGTVMKWFQDERNPTPAAIAVLEMLEERAGIE